MTEAYVYAEGLKTQAARDLKTARLLIASDGYAEHIAWLCGQSYEKILRHAYAMHGANSGLDVKKIGSDLEKIWQAPSLIAMPEAIGQISHYFLDIFLAEDSPMAKALAGPPRELWLRQQRFVDDMIGKIHDNLSNAPPIFSVMVQNLNR